MTPNSNLTQKYFSAIKLYSRFIIISFTISQHLTCVQKYNNKYESSVIFSKSRRMSSAVNWLIISHFQPLHAKSYIKSFMLKQQSIWQFRKYFFPRWQFWTYFFKNLLLKMSLKVNWIILCNCSKIKTVRIIWSRIFFQSTNTS